MSQPKTRKVKLGYEDTLEITIPDGRVVSVLLSYQEPGGQLPELDIMLPKRMAVNNFGDGLVPAPSNGRGMAHVRLARQIIIPIEEPD